MHTECSLSQTNTALLVQCTQSDHWTCMAERWPCSPAVKLTKMNRLPSHVQSVGSWRSPLQTGTHFLAFCLGAVIINPSLAGLQHVHRSVRGWRSQLQACTPILLNACLGRSHKQSITGGPAGHYCVRKEVSSAPQNVNKCSLLDQMESLSHKQTAG